MLTPYKPVYRVKGFDKTGAKDITVGKLGGNDGISLYATDHWLMIQSDDKYIIMPKEQIPAFMKACFAVYKKLKFMDKGVSINEVRKEPELIEDG